MRAEEERFERIHSRGMDRPNFLPDMITRESGRFVERVGEKFYPCVRAQLSLFANQL